MNNNDGGGGIGASLSRKLGPLPVWAWAILAGVVIYYIRNRSSGTSASTLAQEQQAAATAAQQQQTPVTLGPGESVYDPNTGVVSTPRQPVNENQQWNSFWKILAALAATEGRSGNQGTSPSKKKRPPKRPPRKHHTAHIPTKWYGHGERGWHIPPKKTPKAGKK